MKKIILTLLFSQLLLAEAQQLPLTNLYNYNPYQVFSAYAGVDDALQGSLDYRKQWKGIEGSPETIIFTVGFQATKKVGSGIRIQKDNTGVLTRTQFIANYAYHLPIADHQSLSLALGAGFSQTRITADIIGDPTDPVLQSARQGSFHFENEFSALYTLREIEVAFSIPNLIDNTADNGVKTNKRHFIFFTKNDFEISPQLELEPSLLVRATGGVRAQFDLNCLAVWNKDYSFGIGYRDHAGLIFKLGYKALNVLGVNYAYEFFGSGIPSYSFGSHQLQLNAFIPKIERSGGDKPRKKFLTKDLLRFRKKSR